jgi:hypothetical protein
MSTTATLHVHPAAANPFQIFEIRRLAREFGCAFAISKSKLSARAAPAPVNPNGGGHAA